ncbi:MAG: peptidylprolyl isomerase [Tractidigestivibacter sp.]|jgi:peptidyl-prolyl cis-trans isomerase B (cyclophilin B)|uniref:peptidylprolyl isomerase n=1 Tax=Tractidigestivibacter sp. TaxID=2847320 RepID=UPI003D913A97
MLHQIQDGDARIASPRQRVGSQLTRRGFLGALAAAGALVLGACSSEGEGSSSSEGSSGDSGDASSDSSSDSGVITTTSSDDPYSTGVHHATIEVQDYGTMTVALNANMAPITVSNFANLANEGFYDGLTFHRVVSDFMIQGGDPNGDGTGGSDQKIKGEFSDNGVKNTISHVRGTISMARSSDYDSASSQFFIMQKEDTSLNGSYAAFGNVTDGIDVVDAIVDATSSYGDSNGILPADKQPTITSISMVD